MMPPLDSELTSFQLGLVETASALVDHFEPQVVAAIILADAIHRHAEATRLIAHGGTSGPSGLEALAIAIAGEGFSTPLGPAVAGLGDRAREW